MNRERVLPQEEGEWRCADIAYLRFLFSIIFHQREIIPTHLGEPIRPHCLPSFCHKRNRDAFRKKIVDPTVFQPEVDIRSLFLFFSCESANNGNHACRARKKDPSSRQRKKKFRIFLFREEKMKTQLEGKKYNNQNAIMKSKHRIRNRYKDSHGLKETDTKIKKDDEGKILSIFLFPFEKWGSFGISDFIR